MGYKLSRRGNTGTRAGKLANCLSFATSSPIPIDYDYHLRVLTKKSSPVLVQLCCIAYTVTSLGRTLIPSFPRYNYGPCCYVVVYLLDGLVPLPHIHACPLQRFPLRQLDFRQSRQLLGFSLKRLRSAPASSANPNSDAMTSASVTIAPNCATLDKLPAELLLEIVSNATVPAAVRLSQVSCTSL